jgi:hypothetical protein
MPYRTELTIVALSTVGAVAIWLAMVIASLPGI